MNLLRYFIFTAFNLATRIPKEFWHKTYIRYFKLLPLMQGYLNSLESVFSENSKTTVANKQKAYMRKKFDFYGITSPVRKKIQKPFLVKESLPSRAVLHKYVEALWQLPQREYQLFAMDLLLKYVKRFEREDISLLEYLVTHKSWWDTVDLIAVRLIGGYMMSYPDTRLSYVNKWLGSENIWLQRSAVLFQLKYKKELDTDILSDCIHQLLGSKEFFINKAIGWILREYSRTNPEWVTQFVGNTKLQPLSEREAMRLIRS